MPAATSGSKLDGMRYEVVRPLGLGAGSTILLIADAQSGQHYALKVVKRHKPEDDVFLNQAKHEFEVARRLNHPNLLRIYDRVIRRKWFRPSGVELLMEFADGKTLDELKMLDRRLLVMVFIQVAAALEHMHRRGVYHGNWKPGNIMVSRQGEVKVIDFGTAWIKGQPKDRVQGTPQYMAPEQAHRKLVDDRTDLYNLGATMYRMFTGQYANPGGLPQPADGVLARLTRPHPPMSLDSTIPGALSEAILSCLEPNPDRRPAGVFEVKDQLEAVAKYLETAPGGSRFGESRA